MHTITAQFEVTEDVHRRRTEQTYTHASRDSRGKVRFHTSETAARRAAGAFGKVVRTDYAATQETPSGDTWTITYDDGETRDVAIGSKSPVRAGMDARPDATVTGAKRKPTS